MDGLHKAVASARIADLLSHGAGLTARTAVSSRIASILEVFQRHGPPAKRLAPWRSRWWSMYGCTDLVPAGNVVLQIVPALHPPFDAASTELEITGKDQGIIRRTSGYNSPGQHVRLVRDRRGGFKEFWKNGGTRLVSREAMMAEVAQRYRGKRRRQLPGP